MKYLKKFTNHSDYLAFKQSINFVTPNVSYCVTEDEVHYNKEEDNNVATNLQYAFENTYDEPSCTIELSDSEMNYVKNWYNEHKSVNDPTLTDYISSMSVTLENGTDYGLNFEMYNSPEDEFPSYRVFFFVNGTDYKITSYTISPWE